MSAVSSYINNMLSMAKSIGMEALSNQYPNDFEWYMVALELTDSDDHTIDYLTFPIMPNSIQKTEPTRTNIKKSFSGVTVLTNQSFAPQEINIKGSFGRQFKILIDKTIDSSVNGCAEFSTKNGKFDLYSITNSKSIKSLDKAGLSGSVKTGYGVLKILKAMASKSVGLDKKGLPFRLYFYNMAFGESFLVVIPPSGVQYSQDMSQNMIWNYNLTMMAVAPLEAVQNRGNSLGQKLIRSAIQSGVNSLASELTDALSSADITLLRGQL